MSAQTRIDMGCYSRSGFLLGHPGGHIYFYPWEGKNFRQNKLRLLILGESHYGKSNETRDFTWRLTDEIIKGEIRGRFWTQIAQAITGRSRGKLIELNFGIPFHFTITCSKLWPTRRGWRPRLRCFIVQNRHFLKRLTF
jgi:hypothetical protein